MIPSILYLRDIGQLRVSGVACGGNSNRATKARAPMLPVASAMHDAAVLDRASGRTKAECGNKR